MNNLKKQLTFHFYFSRSSIIWYMIIVLGIYAFGLFMNIYNQNGFFSSYENNDTINILTSYSGQFYFYCVLFLLADGIKNFRARFLGVIGFSSTRKDFFLGLVAHSLIISIILSIFHIILLGIDTIVFPMIYDNVQFSSIVPFLQNGYIEQSIFWFALLLFVSLISNIVGVLHYLYGNVIIILFIAIALSAIPIVLSLSENYTVIKLILDQLLFSHNMYIHVLKLFGYTLISAALLWTMIRRLQVQHLRSIKNTIIILGVFLISGLLIFLLAFGVNKTSEITTNPITYETINKEDLQKYNGTYIGDNSSVHHILQKLPGNAFLSSIELKTTTKPYELIAYYDNEMTVSGKNLSETYGDSDSNPLEKNAAIIFTLISNVDQISISSGTENQSRISILYTRKDIMEKYSLHLDTLIP